jgi:hypothetical protein
MSIDVSAHTIGNSICQITVANRQDWYNRTFEDPATARAKQPEEQTERLRNTC